MVRKALIVAGAIIGAVIGYLRTENVVSDMSGVIIGIMAGAFIAYVVYNFVEDMIND